VHQHGKLNLSWRPQERTGGATEAQNPMLKSTYALGLPLRAHSRPRAQSDRPMLGDARRGPRNETKGRAGETQVRPYRHFQEAAAKFCAKVLRLGSQHQATGKKYVVRPLGTNSVASRRTRRTGHSEQIYSEFPERGSDQAGVRKTGSIRRPAYRGEGEKKTTWRVGWADPGMPEPAIRTPSGQRKRTGRPTSHLRRGWGH